MEQPKYLFIATGRYPTGTGCGVSSGQYAWLQALQAVPGQLKVAPSYVHYQDQSVGSVERKRFNKLGFDSIADLDEDISSRAPRLRMIQQSVWPTRAGSYVGIAKLRGHLERLLQQEKPDLVLAYDWPAVTMLTPFADRLPCIAIIVDLPGGNLKSRWQGLSQLPFGRRWREVLRLLGGRGLSRWAIKDLRPFRAVVEHANHHAEFLREQGLKRVRCVPHCMPDPANPESICYHLAVEDEVNILMLGSLKGATSRLGFEFLLQEILPELRRKSDSIQYPYKIRVVGHGTMIPELREKLRKQPEIEFIGFADDVSEEYRLSHFMLVAIPTPVGFRTRIAEAFGYGQCVVAHSANCEGMPEIKKGVNALCADNGKDVADLMISAINDGRLRKKIARAARDTFCEHYSIKAMQRFIEREIEPLAISRNFSYGEPDDADVLCLSDSIGLPACVNQPEGVRGVSYYELAQTALLEAGSSTVLAGDAATGRGVLELKKMIQSEEVRFPKTVFLQVGVTDCTPRVLGPVGRKWVWRISPKWLRLLIMEQLKKLHVRWFFRLFGHRVLVSRNQYRDTMRLIIASLRSCGVERILLASILKTNFQKENVYVGMQKNILEYNRILQGVATREGVQYIEFNDVMVESALYDGVHMNHRGKQVYAQILANELV